MTGRRSRNLAHGMTELETEVMDRWDDGQSKQAISAALGIRKSRVDDIVANFSEAEETRLCHASIRAATAQLGRACEAYRNRIQTIGLGGPQTAGIAV